MLTRLLGPRPTLAFGAAILLLAAGISIAVTAATSDPEPIRCGVVTGYVGFDPEMKARHPGGYGCQYPDVGWVPGEPVEAPAKFALVWVALSILGATALAVVTGIRDATARRPPAA